MAFADLGWSGITGLASVAVLGLALCFAGSASAEDRSTPTPTPAAPSTPTSKPTTAPATSDPPALATPGPATPAPPAPATPASTTPAPSNAGDSEQNMPGIPKDAAAQTIQVAAKPTAILSAKAKWDQAFAAIKATQEELKATVEKAGLKPAGRPLIVFTATDDNGFSYQAMLPLAEKPAGKTELSDKVKLGSSPAGKAIKFQHHGPYSDIDSTYDLITAYLDEKSLEAQDYFVEDYLTDLKSANDPDLSVDIYIFLK